MQVHFRGIVEHEELPSCEVVEEAAGTDLNVEQRRQCQALYV